MHTYILFLIISCLPVLFMDFQEARYGSIATYAHPEQKKCRERFIAWFVTSIILILFGTLRDISVGADYSRYRSHFYSESFFSNYEPGFYYLSMLLQKIAPDFDFFSDLLFTINMLLFLIPLLDPKINKNKNLWVGIFLLQTYFIYGTSFSALRQSIAFGLVVLAIYFLIVSKSDVLKIVTSTILILAAFSFHTSALVCLIFIPAWYINYKSKLRTPIIITSLVIGAIGYVIFPILIKVADNRSHYATYEPTFGYSTILLIVVTILLFIVPDKAKQREIMETDDTSNKVFNFFANSLLLALLLNLFFVWIPVHFRITQYFYVVFIVCIVFLFDWKNKKHWLYLIFMSLYYINILRTDSIQIIPYIIQQ